MPKQKITREMVVDAAFDLARKDGLDHVVVRDIAQKLDCSVQPIYSYCKNMEGLRKDVMNRANEFIREYIMQRLDKNDFFRSTGHTYIRLAQEEPNIFKMFIMNKRKNIDSLDSMYVSETNPQVADFISKALDISVEDAKRLHLNMLIYTIGMGTILTSCTPGIGSEEVNIQLENAYEAFFTQIKERR